MYEPPLNCVFANMDMFDDERNSVAIYTAFFNFDFNCFDGQLTTR